MRTIRDLRTRMHYAFDSLGEYIDYVETAPAAPEGGGRTKSSRRDGRDSWFGASFEGAVDLAREGWPEGLERMTEALEKARLLTKPAMEKTARLDVGGAYPIAAIAAAGDPMCMMEIGEDAAKARPIVRLALQLFRSSSVTMDEIYNWGAALLSQIDAVEHAGFSVELVAIFHTKGSADRRALMRTDIMVKRAGEPLEIDRLAFVIAHSSMFRRLHFAFIETRPQSWRYFIPGYGREQQDRPDDLSDGVMWLRGIRHGEAYWRTPESAHNAMLRQFREAFPHAYT